MIEFKKNKSNDFDIRVLELVFNKYRETLLAWEYSADLRELIVDFIHFYKESGSRDSAERIEKFLLESIVLKCSILIENTLQKSLELNLRELFPNESDLSIYFPYRRDNDIDHIRGKASPFVETGVQTFIPIKGANPSFENVHKFIDAVHVKFSKFFKKHFAHDSEPYFDKSIFNNIVEHRNKIAHGESERIEICEAVSIFWFSVEISKLIEYTLSQNINENEWETIKKPVIDINDLKKKLYILFPEEEKSGNYFNDFRESLERPNNSNIDINIISNLNDDIVREISNSEIFSAVFFATPFIDKRDLEYFRKLQETEDVYIDRNFYSLYDIEEYQEILSEVTEKQFENKAIKKIVAGIPDYYTENEFQFLYSQYTTFFSNITMKKFDFENNYFTFDINDMTAAESLLPPGADFVFLPCMAEKGMYEKTSTLFLNGTYSGDKIEILNPVFSKSKYSKVLGKSIGSELFNIVGENYDEVSKKNIFLLHSIGDSIERKCVVDRLLEGVKQLFKTKSNLEFIPKEFSDVDSLDPSQYYINLTNNPVSVAGDSVLFENVFSFNCIEHLIPNALNESRSGKYSELIIMYDIDSTQNKLNLMSLQPKLEEAVKNILGEGVDFSFLSRGADEESLKEKFLNQDCLIFHLSFLKDEKYGNLNNYRNLLSPSSDMNYSLVINEIKDKISSNF